MATGAVQKVLLKTGAAYDVPIGIVSGGSWGEDANVTTRTGIGGVGVIVPGVQIYKTSFDVAPVNVNCLANKVLRASYPAGALPVVALDVGDNELNIPLDSWVCNSLEASLEKEGALQLSYEFWSVGKPTKGTGNAAAYAPPLTTCEWYNAAAQLGATAIEFEKISFSAGNNLIPRPVLNTAAVGSRRYPVALDVGDEVVTANAVYYANPSHDLSLDPLPLATLVLAAPTSNATPVTITFTGTNMKVTDWSSSFVDGSAQKLYDVNYALNHNSGGFAITVV